MTSKLHLGITLTAVLFGVAVGKVCTKKDFITDRISSIYCSTDCCGSLSFRYCCSSIPDVSGSVHRLATTWIIVIVVAVVVIVATVIGVVICCICCNKGSRSTSGPSMVYKANQQQAVLGGQGPVSSYPMVSYPAGPGVFIDPSRTPAPVVQPPPYEFNDMRL